MNRKAECCNGKKNEGRIKRPRTQPQATNKVPAGQMLLIDIVLFFFFLGSKAERRCDGETDVGSYLSRARRAFICHG